MAITDRNDEELAALVRRVAAAASAFIGGDISAYVDLLPHADDHTLLPPYGGARHGFDHSEESLAATADWFQGGECTLEIVRADRSGDLAVIAAVERQRGVVGGVGPQDWSLRVTLVFRRSGAVWQLVHRHADPLVHPVDHDRVAALARGTAA
jgi:ketosteroid isomerase-like protein